MIPASSLPALINGWANSTIDPVELFSVPACVGWAGIGLTDVLAGVTVPASVGVDTPSCPPGGVRSTGPGACVGVRRGAEGVVGELLTQTVITPRGAGAGQTVIQRSARALPMTLDQSRRFTRYEKSHPTHPKAESS